MFDFFRDIYAEYIGLDPEKVREEKALRRHNNKFALSRIVKITIRIIGIFYLFVAAISITALFTAGIDLTLLKYITAITIDIIVLIFTFSKRKYSGIIVIIGTAAFLGINFLA